MRLCTKYRIDNLRCKALRYLSSISPTTYKDVDIYLDLCPKTKKDGERWPYFHPSLIITLAREIRADFLLPFAFYRWAARRPREGLHGAPDSIAHAQPSLADVVTINHVTHELNDCLISFVRDLRVRSGVPPTSVGCAGQRGVCVAAFRALEARAKDDLVAEGRTRMADPFMRRALVYFEDECTPRACAPCREKFAMFVHQRRQALWDMLPLLIGLPTWEELLLDESH